jgi:hypothetical protein
MKRKNLAVWVIFFRRISLADGGDEHLAVHHVSAEVSFEAGVLKPGEGRGGERNGGEGGGGRGEGEKSGGKGGEEREGRGSGEGRVKAREVQRERERWDYESRRIL